MQSILLCAGFGTRLKPLTEILPKPAVPFLGHPMIAYAMRALVRAGQTRFASNVHYLPEKMAACLKNCAYEIGLEPPSIFHENGEILGTGGGARACLDLLPEDDCYLIYHGDVLCAADLIQAYHEHKASGADVSLVVAPRPEHSKLGMIGIDKRSQIAQIRDWYAADCNTSQDLTPACFTGIHIVNRNILTHIETGKYVCLVTEIYKTMLENAQPIHACMTDAFFADIGTPETYFDAVRVLQKNPALLPGADINAFNAENIDDWQGLCDTISNALPQMACY
jgi:mannose-1-phosphate guanylyltransferase